MKINMSPEFAEALNRFLEGLQPIFDKECGTKDRVKIEFEEGPRYVRVIRIHGSSRAAYAFIEKETGNVLKPASWKAPAKHARGCIYNGDHGLKCCGPYSVAYLR